MATILFGLLLAGHETSTNLLGNALRRLLEDGSRWAQIVADPATVPDAVEEVLRYDSSVVHWRRRTTVPVTLSGVELPAGADVLVCVGAAEPRPGRLRPAATCSTCTGPTPGEHLSFGSGPHLLGGFGTDVGNGGAGTDRERDR